MALNAHWINSHLELWGHRDLTPLSHEELRSLLGELLPEELLASCVESSSLELTLPADEQGHFALSPLTAGGPWHLAQLQVPSLRFTPTETMDLLTSLPPCERLGETLRFWQHLAKLTLGRLVGKQFYPDLESSSPDYLALWRLWLSQPEEIQHLEQLVLAMPPACRAANPQTDPAQLIERFISTTADAWIRRSLANDDFFAQVHQRQEPPEIFWISALLGHQPALSQAVVGELVEPIRAWIARLCPDAAPLRLCFRLYEPLVPAINPEWDLELELHSPTDAHQSLPARELWQKSAEPQGLLGRQVSQAREQLLAEIGRAALVCPLLERLKEVPEPQAMSLSTLDAHVFIRQYADLLQRHGFGVALPGWASQRERSLGMVLMVDPSGGQFDEPSQGQESIPLDGAEMSTGVFGLENLLDFHWQVAIGDWKLTPEEFQELVQQRSGLVFHRGQWIQIDMDGLRKAEEFLQERPSGRISLIEALRRSYGSGETENGLPILGLAGSSWVERFLEQSPDERLSKGEPIPGFHGSLRPYQARGLEWMEFLERLGIGGCLADDMGLGKTIQLIALMMHERRNEKKAGPTLLFAPTSVVGNWVRELAIFAPTLKVVIHHGPQRLVGQVFLDTIENSDVVITSYALAHRDLELLRQPLWHRIALDEAQKIKNPAAASTIAIRSLRTRRRIALTGTPIENHLSELWSIMEMLNPGLLGTAGEFRERFAVPIEKLGQHERAAQLRQLIRPFVLRRTKNDPNVIQELPEKMENRVFCTLTPEQAATYERITAEMLTQIDAASGIRRRGLILTALTRLKQVCDHPALASPDRDVGMAAARAAVERAELNGRSGKCERLAEMLEEVLEEGDSALIFTQYRQMGHILEKFLAERLNVPMQFLHGGTPARQRNAMIERFQEPGRPMRIFLLSLRAGGLGLNLTAANHVFHFDRWWNPAVEAQATDRAYRIGQIRKVQVHKFICVGTMEERIDKLLSDKLALADQIVSTGDQWLTSLSTEELRNYLTLSDDAIAGY